jgi:hypothetical protein
LKRWEGFAAVEELTEEEASSPTEVVVEGQA